MNRWLRFLLIGLMGLVLLNNWLARTSSVNWQHPVQVYIYPVNADQSPVTQAYIDQLHLEQFADIERFFQREAARFHLSLAQPVHVHLAEQPATNPPASPDHASMLDSVLWSLKMRWWVWRNALSAEEALSDVQIYMRFYALGNPQAEQHVLGVQHGQVGLVNAYADAVAQGQSNLVAAHELLHSLGASDKYDPETALPIWPDGYAEPTKQPLLPQARAEIMGGRVQISPSIALVPPGLEHVSLGSATAIEIGWLGIQNGQ